MKTNIAKLTCFAFLAAALIAAPGISRAQDSTNAPAAQTPAPKKHGLPFRGKVATVETNAMTFTVGTRTFGITSETKITKEGKPAVFADIAVGENVTGYYKTDDAGKLTATTVKVGAPKKKDAPKKEDSTSAPAPAAAPQ